jgi:branched-chain amino acid transport system permease protein
LIFVDVLIYGAVLGSILALLASGYSLVYGVAGVLNLAHGAFYVLAGYFVFWFVDSGILAYPYAIVLGLVFITIIGAVVYLALIKPIEQNEIAVMIVTFALGFFIQQGILVVETAKPGVLEPATLPSFIEGQLNIFGTIVSIQSLVVLLGSLIIMVILIIFIKKSKLGKSIRAVSQDKEAAELMGINVSRILMFTVAVSALLAGLAAVLYAPEVGLDAQIMVWDYLLLSMSVVVLGGLGSIPGSLIGAFVISYAKFITLYYIDLPLNTAFSSLIHLALIIVVLIIRPRGILGKKERT